MTFLQVGACSDDLGRKKPDVLKHLCSDSTYKDVWMYINTHTFAPWPLPVHKVTFRKCHLHLLSSGEVRALAPMPL